MRKQNSSTTGFTIVELLIVIVVIAILAAISVVAYRGIQNRAYDTNIKSDLANAARKLELYKVDSSSYSAPPWAPGIGAGFGKDAYLVGPSSSNVNNLLYCYLNDNSAYALVGRSRSDNTYYISNSSGGVSTYSQSWTASGTTTCPNVLPSGTYNWFWGYSYGAGGWQF